MIQMYGERVVGATGDLLRGRHNGGHRIVVVFNRIVADLQNVRLIRNGGIGFDPYLRVCKHDDVEGKECMARIRCSSTQIRCPSDGHAGIPCAVISKCCRAGTVALNSSVKGVATVPAAEKLELLRPWQLLRQPLGRICCERIVDAVGGLH